VSEFGRQVIVEMNRLGIMVDVSHMSKAATLDAIRMSRAPVIASHSGIHAIVPTPRNLDDETLLALAAKGGVVQVAAVHSFVKVDPPGATRAFSTLLDEFGIGSDADAKNLAPDRRAEFEARLAPLKRRWALATVGQMVDHIDYAVSLVGADHVGIGSDFEGGGGLTGWADASETVNVTAELLRRGYTGEEIQKIWGKNLLRVWREVRGISNVQ
jgi:membrane dipeptidase